MSAWMGLLFALSLQGTSSCPTPAAVAALLPEMTPDVAQTSEILLVDAGDDEIVVSVQSVEGGVELVRRLPRAASVSCAELAQAAAVVIATWNEGRRSRVSMPTVEKAPAAVSAVAPRAEPPAGPPPARSGLRRLDIGAAAGLLSPSARGAWTVLGQAGLRQGDARWGLRFSVATQGAQTVSLVQGRSSWRRSTVGLGPTCELFRGFPTLALEAQAFAGWVRADGAGYTVDRHDQAMSIGVDGAARLSWPIDRWELFLVGDVRWWSSAQDIVVAGDGGDGASVALPRWDERVLVGLSFSLVI